MLNPDHLAALAAIHRRGSFDLAAAALHVTPSAVSQRLKALEEEIGTLLIRRGQPCRATETGLRLIRHFDAVSLMEKALTADLPGLPDGPVPLRIAVNADSLATWVIPALAKVPGFLFDIVIDDQDVSQDWLRRGEVVAAVTSHPGPLQGSAEALAHAPALTFSDKDRLQEIWVARVTEGKVARAGFPSHHLASSQGFVDACVHGLGWALNPDSLVRDQMADGRLVELVPGEYLDVALHWQFARLTGPAIQPLTDALRAAARAALHP